MPVPPLDVLVAGSHSCLARLCVSCCRSVLSHPLPLQAGYSPTHAPIYPPPCQQVSFLAAMVGPKIASAAAQRALEVLAEEDAAAAAGVAQQMAAAEAGVDIDMPDAGGAAPKNGDKAAGEGVSLAGWRDGRLAGWKTVGTLDFKQPAVEGSSSSQGQCS